MSDEKMVMLKSALGGYSKKDVNKYIEKISLDFARREDELKAEAENQRRAVSDAKQRTEELSRMLDELACEAYSSENVALEAKKDKDSASEREKELAQMLDELACRLYAAEKREEELKASLAGMASRIAEYENRENEDVLTGEVVEKIRTKTEEMICMAGEEAKDIISSAESKAEELISQAKLKAENIISEANAKAGATEGKIKKMYSTAAEDYCEQIKKLTEEMTSSADRARKKQEERPLQNEKTSTIDDKIDTFFRALFSQINPKNKNRS